KKNDKILDVIEYVANANDVIQGGLWNNDVDVDDIGNTLLLNHPILKMINVIIERAVKFSLSITFLLSDINECIYFTILYLQLENGDSGEYDDYDDTVLNYVLITFYVTICAVEVIIDNVCPAFEFLKDFTIAKFTTSITRTDTMKDQKIDLARSLRSRASCKPRPKEKDTAPFAPWQLNPPIHKTQNPPKYGHVDVMKTEILAKHGSMDNYSKYLKQKKIPIATSLPPPTLPPIVSYRGTGLGSIALVTPANFPVHPYPGEKEENYERLKIQIEGQLIQSTPLTLEEQLLQLYAIEEERDIREAVKDEACNKAEERIRQRDRQRLRRRYGHWLSDRIELEKEKGKQIVQNQTQNMHLDLQEDEKLALRAFLNVPPPSRSDLKRLDKYDRRAFERERDIEREYRLSDYADGNDREKLFFYNGFFVGKQQAGLGFELEKGVDYEDILADDGLNRQGAWDVINHQDGVQQHKTYSQNDAIDIKGDQKSNENQNAINWKNYQIRNKLREDNQIQNFDNQQIQDQSQNQRIPIPRSSPGSGLNTNQNNQNKDSSFITDVGLITPLTPHQHNEQIQKITPLPIQSAKHSQSSKIQQHTGNTTSLSRSQLETPKFVSSAPSTTTRRWKELDMRSSAVREYQSDREADVLEKANEIIYRAETENWFGFQNDGGEKQ
ncbi:MAG: hypothetical protein EZS28_019809, partial [Streblomastix strix]